MKPADERFILTYPSVVLACENLHVCTVFGFVRMFFNFMCHI